MDTPTLDKIAAVHEQSQAIGEFLRWLLAKETLTICRYTERAGFAGSDAYIPVSQSINSMLAEYFEIDLAAAERERRAILAALRESAPPTKQEAHQ